MALVAAFRTEDALRADLQEYYGVDIDHAMAGAHTARHVGALVSQLPDTSRIAMGDGEDSAWTPDRTLMAGIMNILQYWRYGMADPRKRGSKPDVIGPSWMKPRSTLPARVLSVDELLKELQLPREEEIDG